MEMLTGVSGKGYMTLSIDRMDMIKNGQKVENDYIGVNSGIMGQFQLVREKRPCYPP
jgi:galactokinase